MSDEVVAPTTKEPFFKRMYTYFCVTTPKAVYFLFWNRALENFAGYGIVAVTMIYLKEELGLPQALAKMIYHISHFAIIPFPVLGAVLAATYIGKFWLIISLDFLWMIVYAGLSATSYTPFGISKTLQRDLTITFLVLSKLRGLSTPSVMAFPGDQYDESKTEARDEFYSALYFAINLGSALAFITTPRLRADINCIPDSENCFPAAFGVPVAVSLFATVILWAGFHFYKLLQPERKQNWNLLKCFALGLYRAFRSLFRHKRSHWLDLADDKYSEKDIADAKAVWKLMILFSAYPMFWTLFDQQSSMWTMMSSKLDGRTVIGQILPDQMDAANPFIVMFFIPLFTIVIYPLCAKISFLRTPLERIGYGFILGAVCYVIGGILCIVVENNVPAYPSSDKTDIVFHNGLPCDLTAGLGAEKFTISKYKSFQSSDIDVSASSELNVTVGLADEKCSLGNISSSNFVISTPGGYAYSVLFKLENSTVIYEQGEAEILFSSCHLPPSFSGIMIVGSHVERAGPYLEVSKWMVFHDQRVSISLTARQNRSRNDQTNAAKVRFIYIGKGTDGREIVLDSPGLKACYPLEDIFRDNITYGSANVFNHETNICFRNPADNTASDTKQTNCSCKNPFTTYIFVRGGIYDVMVIEHDEGKSEISVFVTAEPDSVPMLLQLPMYIMLTMGEVMCSVTAYSFAYSESPEYTKSIMQSLFYVSISVGNLYVIIIDWILGAIVFSFQSPDPERPRDIPAPSTIFFVYAALMVLNTIYFVFVARRYTYTNPLYQNIKKKNE